MDPTQFPSAPPGLVPAAGDKPRLRDAAWLIAYGARGLWELVGARFAFMRFQASEIPRRNATSQSAADCNAKADPVLIARIAYVLPRISARLPWRSDCLVQAIAGQNWLMANALASEIQIGVENPENGEFGAHAWLIHNGTVVTGGDIARYDLLLGDSAID